ncbi:MAG TPA: hypothetical protein VI461_02160 [Chitinophagaceae bacterium]|nr:hypothetical protein [Chitinophagaceae bacterium]
MRIATIKPLLVLSLIIVFVSCQKEASFENGGGPGGPGGGGGTGGGGNTSNIVGDYDFVGIVAHTKSTVTVNAAGQELKTITISDYASESNSGTVKITSNQFIGTDLAYSIDTTMNAKTYVDNVLLDDSDFPFVFSVPPTSSTSSYVRVSSDSITVTGTIGTAPDPSGTPPTGPIGVKLSWSGDTLLMKMSATVTQTIDQGGVPATVVGSVIGTTKLKKR